MSKKEMFLIVFPVLIAISVIASIVVFYFYFKMNNNKFLIVNHLEEDKTIVFKFPGANDYEYLIKRKKAFYIYPDRYSCEPLIVKIDGVEYCYPYVAYPISSYVISIMSEWKIGFNGFYQGFFDDIEVTTVLKE